MEAVPQPAREQQPAILDQKAGIVRCGLFDSGGPVSACRGRGAGGALNAQQGGRAVISGCQSGAGGAVLRASGAVPPRVLNGM